MDISLVICAYNEEKYIGATLDTALRHSNGAFKDIIVIDNASTDATARVAQRPGVRVVREERKGTGFARQRGLEETRTEFVAFIDADTHIPADWLEKAERIFSRNPKAVSLSGPARYWDATLFQKIAMNLFWWASAPLTYRAVGYMVYGANFIARREALIAAGGFDRSITFYGDDTDVARRLSTQGKTLFRMDFFVSTSARRLRTEGIIGANAAYALNYLWPVFFKRPYHTTHRDVRG